MRRLLHGWVNHPATDWLIVAALEGIYIIVAVTGVDPLAELPRGSRIAFYISATTVLAAVLGFSVTAVAIVAALTPGPRVDALQEQFGGQLVRTLMGSLWVVAATTLGFTVLIVFDGDSLASAARFAAPALLAAATLRVSRLLYVLGRLLQVAMVDRTITTTPDNWDPPRIEPADYTMPKQPRSA